VEAVPAPAAPAEDPVVTLIAASEEHFKAGREALELGHVEAARLEFDKAVNVLLESTYGGRTEPRIREHFDRLVDRISAYEVKALAEGDGFTEKKYEPATIDELLAASATITPPEATPEVEEAVQNDPVVHDVPIPQNPRVLSFVQLFQGRLREFIQEGLQRGSKYLPMIQNVFRAEGLPLDLAYIPLVESAFKPNALSRAKAKGVWQFMRGTGVENGLRQDWYIDERSDPEKATVAAAKYLTTLVKMFDGDWHLALASYNGGPGRVQRALKQTRTTDFWSLAAKGRALPRETRDYVPMILAAIIIARNPAQYGFEFVPDSLIAYDTVTLPKPVDLRRVAEWTNTTIDEIQALNPELRRWTTPVRDAAYELKVPAGTSPLVTAMLDDSLATELASLKWYTVRKGETLATVARRLGVSRTDLAEANYLRTNARIAAGQKLMVPHESTVLLAARTDRPVPAAESRALNTADPVVPAVASGPSERVKVFYRVKRGDTLASIARLFRTTVSALQTWNNIDGTRIIAGDRLTIYTANSN
jgi:membrane-bound lytic murein transglycosylase D